ncbi:MAG: hypothetical protein ACI4JC_10360 [Faecalibacterium sp.]
MNVSEAITCLDELRPGSRIRLDTKYRWLWELDGMLRQRFFRRCGVSWEGTGADQLPLDELQDETELLVPAPFDSLYPHYLCAMTDAALGETDRYAGEQAQYNSILAELAAWLRREYPSGTRAQWRW